MEIVLYYVIMGGVPVSDNGCLLSLLDKNERLIPQLSNLLSFIIPR
jgi:hypothetical protein